MDHCFKLVIILYNIIILRIVEKVLTNKNVIYLFDDFG